MQVRELMNSNVISISPDESAALAARLIARHNIGALPVCSNEGSIRGVVTDRDIVLRCVAAEEDPSQTPVRNIMSRNTFTISPDDDIRAASHVMSEKQVRRLPVIEQGKVVGMLSLGDLAVSNNCDMEAAKALSEISENVHHP
jgi:CBS domain-containing protein